VSAIVSVVVELEVRVAVHCNHTSVASRAAGRRKSQLHASKWQVLNRVAKTYIHLGYYTTHFIQCINTMSGEDDDLKLQRASSALLSDLEKLLPRLVRGRQHGSATSSIRKHVREVDMHRACALVRFMIAAEGSVVDLQHRLSLSRKIPSFLIRI
jgi:hypothetical protein